jgi:hypothetical protein
MALSTLESHAFAWDEKKYEKSEKIIRVLMRYNLYNIAKIWTFY